jgi:hypothetical protein
MTLRQFLSVLASNKGTQVTLVDLEDTELLTFNIEGYETVEGDVLARGVKKATLSRTPQNVSLKIVLFAAVTPEPDDGGTN